MGPGWGGGLRSEEKGSWEGQGQDYMFCHFHGSPKPVESMAEEDSRPFQVPTEDGTLFLPQDM